MKVYIITSGDYSDYHIDAVCETFEAARRKCMLLSSRYGCDSYRVEVWDTETGACSMPEGNYYHVWYENGALHCALCDSCAYEFLATDEYHNRPDIYNFHFSIDGLRAKDEAHALKMASDTLAEYKALLEGV